MNLQFSEKYAENVLGAPEIAACIQDNEVKITGALAGRLGLQNFLGWLSVEKNADDAVLAPIKAIAAEIRKNADALVVVGVGGSNRTACALSAALRPAPEADGAVEIVYGGNNLSGYYMQQLLEKLKNVDFYINVIAKDFHTLEPGIGFRMLRKLLRQKYGEKYAQRIIVTGSYGAEQLFPLAQKEGIRFLEFPKEVGGRFTAFTAVTFLPLLAAGLNIDEFLAGGKSAEKAAKETDVYRNAAVRYAVCRYLLERKGFHVESLTGFEPCLENFSRWALQLHGESEGKGPQAILPQFTNFSEDLHAIGQYIQDGRRFIFETFFDIRQKTNLMIESDGLADGFEYVDGKPFDVLNQAVLEGSRQAHFEAGIPVLTFSAPELSERTFGELFYTFMMSAYVSSVLIGVEPFDQPGVESYKKNMYRLLGK